MLLELSVMIAALVAWSATATRPADRSSRRRDHDRRLRQLGRRPDRVGFLDVENLLLAESVPTAAVTRVMRRATSRRMSARTMWRWAHAYGADRLVTVVDAGVAEAALLDHLDAGTQPNWGSLEIFARLAGDATPAVIPLDELPRLEPAPDDDLTFLDVLTDWSTASPDPLELRDFDNLPPIFGPGFAPFRPTARFDGADD